jgi:tetratricopeptide (TPR) repeat protein
MHYTPLFYWQAALIRTRVRDLGCRFDPALAVCEDRDFLLQIASHGDFAFLPAAATFRFRPDLGTSGTGHGVNRDAARVARFDNLLRAKWAGAGELHNERAAWRCRAGVRAYFARDYDRARAMFEQVLAEYPDDPNALHGMARVALAAGERDEAARYVRKAIDVNPRASEFRATLAEIAPDEAPARRETHAASRLAMCSCGSGKRFKACCGSLMRLDSAPRAVDRDVERANEQRLRGNAVASAAWFRSATADPRASRDCLVAAARLELDLGVPEAALPLLERAAAIRVDTEVGTMLEECCALLAREQRDASLWSTTHTLIGPSPARPSGDSGAQTVHLVVDALQPNSIDIANRMKEALGDRAAVLAIEPGSALPMSVRGTCLVLVDEDLDFDAPYDAYPARVVVRMFLVAVAPLDQCACP